MVIIINGKKILGLWLSTQKQNYKNNEHIMVNLEIKKQWENFIFNNKYKNYFENNKQQWINILNEVNIYIKKNNKIPQTNDKDDK
jgi:hypothetical protein